MYKCKLRGRMQAVGSVRVSITMTTTVASERYPRMLCTRTRSRTLRCTAFSPTCDAYWYCSLARDRVEIVCPDWYSVWECIAASLAGRASIVWLYVGLFLWLFTAMTCRRVACLFVGATSWCVFISDYCCKRGLLVYE